MSADNLIAIAQAEGLWYVKEMFESSLDAMTEKEAEEKIKTGKPFISEKAASKYAHEINAEEGIAEYGVQYLGSYGEPVFLKLARIV